MLQATVCDVVLTLPYDQDFGRAERFCELWSKAFQQVTQTLTEYDVTHCQQTRNKRVPILLGSTLKGAVARLGANSVLIFRDHASFKGVGHCDADLCPEFHDFGAQISIAAANTLGALEEWGLTWFLKNKTCPHCVMIQIHSNDDHQRAAPVFISLLLCRFLHGAYSLLVLAAVSLDCPT